MISASVVPSTGLRNTKPNYPGGGGGTETILNQGVHARNIHHRNDHINRQRDSPKDAAEVREVRPKVPTTREQ